jgi:hypothetical protein
MLNFTEEIILESDLPNNIIQFEDITPEKPELPTLQYLDQDRKSIAFPLSDMPTEIQLLLLEAAEITKTSIEMCAMPMLHVMNTAVMAHANVKIDNFYKVPINLFIINVADSGEGKSPVDKLFSKPLREWETRLDIKHDIDMKRYLGQKERWNVEMNHINDKFKKTTTLALDDLNEFEKKKEEEPVKPEQTMIAVGDFNGASLRKQAKINGLPIMSIKTNEGGSIFCNERWKREGTEVTTNLNSFFDDESITVTRAGDGITKLVGKRVNLFIQIQEDLLNRAFKTNSDMHTNGFIPRAILCFPPEMKSERSFKKRNEPLSFKWINYFYNLIEPWTHKKIPLKEFKLEDGSIKILNQVDLPSLELSDEAREIWEITAEDNCKKTSKDGEYRNISSCAVKSGDRMLRIAATLHLSLGHDICIPIGIELMRAAISIESWNLKQHIQMTARGKENKENHISAALVLFEALKKLFPPKDLESDLLFKISSGVTARLPKNDFVNLRSKKERKIQLDVLVNSGYLIKGNDDLTFKFNPEILA